MLASSTSSCAILCVFLINVWRVRSTHFKEYWQYSFENDSISLSADDDPEYDGPSAPMSVQTMQIGEGDYIFEQTEPQRSPSGFRTLYQFHYAYEINGSNGCVVSYKFGNNSEYITHSPSMYQTAALPNFIDIFQKDAGTETLYVKMETVGTGTGQCEWQEAVMYYPDYGEECAVEGDDECIIMSPLKLITADGVWHKVGCYNSYPYYFSNSTSVDKYLCKALSGTGGWFISSTECGTHQQEKEWNCQTDAVFGMEPDYGSEHDMYRCNGMNRWYRDFQSDDWAKSTALMTSCTNVSMEQNVPTDRWPYETSPICLHVKDKDYDYCTGCEYLKLNWTQAVFDVVDTLILNGKPIYYLLGEGDYYLYDDYDHPFVWRIDGEKRTPIYRDGVVYYIYWMEGDDLGEVQPAWVLMPNRVYRKYSDDYVAPWDSIISIGKIIGQCFEENIADCTPEKWESNFYDMAVNGEECAGVTWEEEEDDDPFDDVFGNSKGNKGVIIGVLIAVFALVLIAFGIGWIAWKSKKSRHANLDHTEPLSDVENNGDDVHDV